MKGICIYMNGDQCAEQYCDFWDREELKCSKALKTTKKVELLDILIEKIGKADDSKVDGITDDRKLHFLLNQMIGEQHKIH